MLDCYRFSPLFCTVEKKGKKNQKDNSPKGDKKTKLPALSIWSFLFGLQLFFVCFLSRVEEIKNWPLNTGPRFITDNFRGSSKLWSLVSFRFIGAQINTVYWGAGHCNRFLNVGFPVAREGCIYLFCWLVK